MFGLFKNKFSQWMIGGLVLLESGVLHAEGSIAELSNNILAPVSLFTRTLYNACYILGAMLIMSSIVHYRDHRTNPSQVPFSRPVLLLIFGLLLIGLPFIGHLTAGASFLGSKH